MKKTVLIVTLVVCGLLATQAQSLKKGEKILNLGFGIGNSYSSGDGYTNTVPPLSVSLEQVVKTKILDGKGAFSIGGYLAYAAAKFEVKVLDDSYGWKYTYLIIGPRGILHYKLIDNLDTYVGVTIGYCVVTAKETGTIATGASAKGSGIAKAGFVGARYYFNKKVAAMVEAGAGITNANIGLAFKL